MKKRKARLRGTKTAGKFEQKKLIERMNAILENPCLVLPKTNKNDIGGKIYDKVHEEMLLAKEQYKNPPSLISSIFGKKPKDPLSKAYAASLSILDSGAPVMAVARFPHGEVNYVMRGYGVSKEKLIGIQNHHHRLWSRFAHLDYVKKYKLFIYSLEKGLVCTGDIPNYPKELWKEVVSNLKISDKQMDSNCLKIKCKSLNSEACISNRKMKKSKENSYSHFLKDQISVEPDLDFEIELITFLSPLVNNIDSKIVKEYRKGLITDAKFLENSIAFQKDSIVNGNTISGQHFVVANEILDKETLISKLCASKIDEAIVEDLLTEFSDSLILEQGTLAYFTEKLWEDYGSSLANKISNNSSNSYNGNNSLEILRKLYDQIIKESLTSDYPSFSNLGESLKLLDKVVKMVKIGDKNKAIKYIDDSNSNNNITKSVCWAVLICLNSTSSRAWKYGKEEKALGETLSKQMQLLLDSDPENYKVCLESISESIGLGNKLEVI
tara:strand:- start:1415 stop:2902 length:1488 start_codon:yes stop_codon:yes gene_type:complete